MNTPELREQCAQRLLAGATAAGRMTAFVGLDGFVDEILHVVDKRDSADSFQRLATISQLAGRLAAAAGKSTNIEIVNRVTKLGGNGPIMANALASFGLKVTYLGNLGWPNLHPVFADFAKHADVHSIAEPGHTDALEFDDGKVMIGKILSLNDVNWSNIQSRYGRDKFTAQLTGADLVGFVNWTMLTHMGEIWEATLKEICLAIKGKRRVMFFDLADPEKRKPDDIRHALKTIVEFEKYFDVVLGLNEKEALRNRRRFGIADHRQIPGRAFPAGAGNQPARAGQHAGHSSRQLRAGCGQRRRLAGAGPVHPQTAHHHRRR